MIDRRVLIKILALTSIGAAAQDDPAAMRPKEGDLIVKAGDAAKRPLTPADIPLGAMQTVAWAMDPADGTVRSGSRLNAVMLLRLDPATLAPETRERSADGVVAYTLICTHNGCDIDDWLAAVQQVSCSCHSSTFDPKDGARVRRRSGAAAAAGAAAQDRRRETRGRQGVHHTRRLRNAG